MSREESSSPARAWGRGRVLRVAQKPGPSLWGCQGALCLATIKSAHSGSGLKGRVGALVRIFNSATPSTVDLRAVEHVNVGHHGSHPPGPVWLNGWSWAGPPCNADLYEQRPLCLQRRPESAVRLAAEVVGLHDEAHRGYLANVPRGAPCGFSRSLRSSTPARPPAAPRTRRD